MIKDICTREEYEKDGETKVSWNKVGIMIDKGDKQYVKLFHMPGQLLSVFEQKSKDGSGQARQSEDGAGGEIDF